MAFVRVPGITGQLYVAEHHPGRVRKHPCEDCTACMLCNDDKCAMCLQQKKNPPDNGTGSGDAGRMK